MARILVKLAMLAVVLYMVDKAESKRNRGKNYSEICQLDSETGSCRAAITRWYFDRIEGECKTFTWGGCGGNDNRFNSKTLCDKKCKPGTGGDQQCSQRRCRKHCEFGFMKDANDCTLCACNPSPNAANCPEFECPNNCPSGYRTDAKGCTTCECKAESARARRPRSSESCPPLCYMYCPYGNKQDENGCDICECFTKEEVCGSQQCRMECPAGFATDARGCDLCECRPATAPVVDCSPVRCRKACAFGFAKDSFGCEICACATTPSNANVDCSARPSCNMYCAYGFVKGRDGCDKCKCAKRNSGRHLGRAGHRRPTISCADKPMCAMYCADGYKKDEQGCNMCACDDNAPAQLPATYAGEAPAQLLAAPAPAQLPATQCRPRRRCRMHCAFGFIKDSFGCERCICKDSNDQDDDHHCDNRPMCRMYCQFGFRKDVDGCNKCECNDTPDCSARPICRMYCSQGFKKGSDGCDTCECNDDAPVVAPHGKTVAAPAAPAPALHSAVDQVPCDQRPMCLMYCEFGFRKGSDGCDVCECNDAPSHCALRPMCRKYCVNGFLKGSDGCFICKCA